MNKLLALFIMLFFYGVVIWGVGLPIGVFILSIAAGFLMFVLIILIDKVTELKKDDEEDLTTC